MVDTSTETPAVRSGNPYQLVNQKVDLEIDFSGVVRGTTQITLFPETKDLKGIVLHARQSEIQRITINGLNADVIDYRDPYEVLDLHIDGTVHQYHILREKLSGRLSPRHDEELLFTLPAGLQIKENPEFIVQTDAGLKTAVATDATKTDLENVEVLADTQVSRYTKLEVVVQFTSRHTRDVLHFVRGSHQWPHVYTRSGFTPGRISSLFPCIDSLYKRCSWEISIKGPRTVGDALSQMGVLQSNPTLSEAVRAHLNREMVYVCGGDLTDDMVDQNDPNKRIVSFAIVPNTSAQHIGFAIGPFEKVDLAAFRDSETAELLQENASPISAYCLPGRQAETENTCLMSTDAIDYFVKEYSPYPFTSFTYCFVDDYLDRPASFAGLSICSSRLLYPESVIDGIKDITRTLVESLAVQWLGIQIIPERPEDTWVVLGAALYITELYMLRLCDKNEHRFRMKQLADRVCELDKNRPSIWDMGALLHVDDSEYDFMALKAPVVLYILDRRSNKVMGSPKMAQSISKVLSKARNEDLKDNLLGTNDFIRIAEKAMHGVSLDAFINQWVKGAGVPTFQATHKFNKKKLVIDMTIRQMHGTLTTGDELNVNTFMRDAREEIHAVYATPLQPVFTGPMTIRIHEADGTPYEHIVEIKEQVTTIEIPYNTKYKRLKRGRKQRQRGAARGGEEDEQEQSVYSLGDTLQSEEDFVAWRFADWSEEDQMQIDQESYEWLRLDADFEWICNTQLIMKSWLWTSQLQQDQDVAAQLMTLQQFAIYPPHAVLSTVLTRTIMDSRYFHSIRTAAIGILARQASNQNDMRMLGLFQLKKIWEELFCVSDGESLLTRPNDFSDHDKYQVQLAIVRAMSRVRDDNDHAPAEVKEFLLDKLRYNDNSANDFSDAHFVAALLEALTTALIARPRKPTQGQMDIDTEAGFHDLEVFERSCLNEIDRYRRMDEWTSSYQNLYSRTALECQARLQQAGITYHSASYFIQFTRSGNFDMLRNTAYNVLADLDLFSNPVVVRYFISSMINDGSLWIRARARLAFGRAIAQKAIGEKKVNNPDISNLVIEDVDLDVQTAEAARRTSIEAALDALKKEMGHNEWLQQFLYEALCHPNAGFEDKKVFLEYCIMLYEPVNKCKVSIILPRYWQMERLGHGKVRFIRSKKIRTKIVERWQSKGSIPTASQTKIPLKISLGKRKDSLLPPTAASSAPPSVNFKAQPKAATAKTQAQQPRQILKLKLSKSGS